MELRDLEYFALVARHGSLSRASNAMDLSPAALSKCLRRLEAAVEARLVERTAKGVTLTSAGKLLLGKVEKLRLIADDVKREAAEIGAGRVGDLRVGMNQIACEPVTIACMALFTEAPRLKLELLVANNDEMVPRLLNGELDLVVSMQPDAPFDGTEREILFRDEMVVCASPTHPLARRRRLTFADIAQEPWVLTGLDVLVRQVVERAFRQAGLPPPRVAVESRSLPTREIALANSRTLGFLSRRALKQTCAGRNRLIELPVKELVWPVSIGAMYRKDAYLPRAAQRLIEVLRSKSAD